MTEATELAAVRRVASDGSARRIRRAAGLSLAEVANELGVTIGTVSKWETGARSPRRAAALKYAEVLRQLLEVEALP